MATRCEARPRRERPLVNVTIDEVAWARMAMVHRVAELLADGYEVRVLEDHLVFVVVQAGDVTLLIDPLSVVRAARRELSAPTLH